MLAHRWSTQLSVLNLLAQSQNLSVLIREFRKIRIAGWRCNFSVHQMAPPEWEMVCSERLWARDELRFELPNHFFACLLFGRSKRRQGVPPWAKRRGGRKPCQSSAMINARCRLHAGPSPGAPKGHAIGTGTVHTRASASRLRIQSAPMAGSRTFFRSPSTAASTSSASLGACARARTLL